MDDEEKLRESRKWPISLPRLDTASRIQSWQTKQAEASSRAGPVDRRQYGQLPDKPRQHQSIRDRTHIHRHGHLRSRTKDGIQSPFDYNPLKAAFGSVAFGSSKADVTQTTQRDSKPAESDQVSIIGPAPVTEADVQRERRYRHSREQEVVSAVTDLLSRAQDATRRLDDTFYELLSKTTDLSTQLASLRELQNSAVTTREHVLEGITSSSSELGATLKRFGDFREQRRTIEGLQSRLRGGKARSQELETRLRAVNQRLDRIENCAMELRRSRSARWRMIVMCLAIVFALVMALFTWRRIHGAPSIGNPTSSNTRNSAPSEPEDERVADRLRVLDEL